ncbi:MAG: hypothetical protein AAF251_12395 [Pseudomonadota bacterium]
MRFSHPRSLVLAGLSIALLSACAAEEAPEQSEPSADTAGEEGGLSAESLVMAETAWLSVTEEGEVFTTYLDGDGRYRDVREGEVIYGGAWEQNQDRELCFTPDSGEGTCWAHGAPGLNGVMRAMNNSGRAIEVRKVIYTTPPLLGDNQEMQDEEGKEASEASETSMPSGNRG